MKKKPTLRNNRKKNPKLQEKARERIKELFVQAELAFHDDQKRSDRYASLARKIALKYKVHFLKEQKLKYCKKCGSFLSPGKTSRVRLNKGKVVVLCLKCKNIMRFAYK
jgi:ribonuclease P protein subunit RPR2